MPGAWVQLLVRELRSYKLPYGVKKKKKDFGDQVQERELRLSDSWSMCFPPYQHPSMAWGFFPMRIAEHLRRGTSPCSFGFSVYPVRLLLPDIYPGAPSPHTQAQTSTGTEKLVKCSLSMSYTIFHPRTTEASALNPVTLSAS